MNYEQPLRLSAALRVLDTHVLIWYFTGSRRLKRRAREAIDDCINEGGKLLAYA